MAALVQEVGERARRARELWEAPLAACTDVMALFIAVERRELCPRLRQTWRGVMQEYARCGARCSAELRGILDWVSDVLGPRRPEDLAMDALDWRIAKGVGYAELDRWDSYVSRPADLAAAMDQLSKFFSDRAECILKDYVRVLYDALTRARRIAALCDNPSDAFLGLVDKATRRARERLAAVMMAQLPRLGRASPLQRVDPCLLAEVARRALGRVLLL